MILRAWFWTACLVDRLETATARLPWRGTDRL